MASENSGPDLPRTTFKLTVAYDGTAYSGWQAQRGRRTIQGELERALLRILRCETIVRASGRTDAGVHALGQVVSFEAATTIASPRLQRALNGHLPADISVLTLEEAPPGFHATYDAVGKLYRYVLCDGPLRDVFRQRYCWQYPQRLCAETMHEAAQLLLGTHDFRSFESHWPNRQSSVRTVARLDVRREAATDTVTVEAYADGFLYNMVRALVGTLVEVGRGRRPAGWVGEVLAAQDRGRAGHTAPPQGLYLVQVDFPPPDELAAQAARRLQRSLATPSSNSSGCAEELPKRL